jgi:hypothetical protein
MPDQGIEPVARSTIAGLEARVELERRQPE